MKFSSVFCAASATAMPADAQPRQHGDDVDAETVEHGEASEGRDEDLQRLPDHGQQGEQDSLVPSQGMGPDDRFEGIHDAQNHPCDGDDQQDLLQGVEHAAHGQGELQWPAREGEDEHDDQQSAPVPPRIDAQHRRQLAPPSPQQPEPQSGDQQSEAVAEADEDREGQPLPELGVEKLRLEEHPRQRLSEQPDTRSVRTGLESRPRSRPRSSRCLTPSSRGHPLEPDVDRLTRVSRCALAAPHPGEGHRRGAQPGCRSSVSTSIGSFWSRTIFR